MPLLHGGVTRDLTSGAGPLLPSVNLSGETASPDPLPFAQSAALIPSK